MEAAYLAWNVANENEVFGPPTNRGAPWIRLWPDDFAFSDSSGHQHPNQRENDVLKVGSLPIKTNWVVH